MKFKATDFVKGILSLVISQVLIKIFGVMYSLYLTNKTGFGDKGNAIYMSGYQIYALLLTISSIGIPNAISKIISERKSQKDYINLDRIFKISIFLFAIIGSVGCACLFVGAGFISDKILDIPEAKLSLMVLSPAVFFVSVSSVIKGYCNGENKIYITAKSQFFEQVLKSSLTILFVEIFSKITTNNTEIMAAVANFATTMATFLSLIYIICKYIHIKNENLYFNGIIYKKERIINIIKKILIISVPMTISAILTSFGKNIDSITVVRILKDIIGEEKARVSYGILSSKVDTLIAMPLSFNIAISTALIPEISKRKAINDLDGIVEKIKFSICMTLVIAIPCSVGMFAYSKQIFNLLFPNAKAGYQLLSLASISIIFSMLTQTINGVLQGLGKNNAPVYASVVGLILKIISNIIFIPMKGIYEKGAVIGNIVSSLTSFIIVYIILRKNIELDFSIINSLLKPVFASAIMIFSSLRLYNFLIAKNINANICTIISMLIAVGIYGFCVLGMKMLKINENSESIENT